jgi:DNA helicase II / ATP-dependent DNA helicase PcrA
MNADPQVIHEQQFQPSDEQRRILAHPVSQHGCVEAGPGTGKSATLVELVDRLLSDGDDPPRVRLLTFTRAATAELAKKFGATATQVERPSTIHSFAISVLVRNPGAADYPEPLRMADDWENENLVLPSLARRMGIGVTQLKALFRELQANWESLAPEDDPNISEELRSRFLGTWDEHRRVYGYTLLSELPYLLRQALIDHPDLTGLDYDLLLVDEYQDLNPCDLEALHLLSDRGCSILAAGDEDQSIYSFRKAAPEGIRRFATDYAGAAIYPLTITRRCGRRIVAWARSVIERDPDRDPSRPRLRAANDAEDGELAILAFNRQDQESRGVADLIEHLIKDERIPPGEILVLSRGDRAGLFSAPIKEELEQRGIPVCDPSVVKRALEDSDNRRSLEVLRLTVRRNDPLAWAALCELTPGVGTTFVDYVYARAAGARRGFGSTLLDLHRDRFLGGPASSQRMLPVITEVSAWLDAHPLPVEEPDEGWGTWMVNLTGDPIVPSFTSDLTEILIALDDLAESSESGGFGRFLNQVQPLGSDLAAAREDGVRFMTMAASKGLTVQAVIIIAAEEGIIPRPQASLAEERRLLYVALTRARRFTYTTWSRRRTGPTARSGQPNVGQRRKLSSYLMRGPASSVDGARYISERWPE